MSASPQALRERAAIVRHLQTQADERTARASVAAAGGLTPVQERLTAEAQALRHEARRIEQGEHAEGA